MSIAFIFPGQGSQAVGMGAELAKAYPQARAVFDEIDAALKQNLSSLMWDGPESELTLTENAQPALMAVSLAAMRVLAEKGLKLPDRIAYVAGHSLGEYSALAAALAPKFGARRAVLLPVSAPFHCALMQPAADAMREALAGVKINSPAVPLIANVLASP